MLVKWQLFNQNNFSYYFLASRQNSRVIAELLIAADANLDLRSSDGSTALTVGNLLYKSMNTTIYDIFK